MNPSTASNGNEWQTAGKSKSSKPKPKPQPSTIETNLTNGHAYAAGDGPHMNHSASANQNGTMHNGAGNRRGGRQSSGSAYGGRPNQNMSNSQSSRPTSSKEDVLSKRKLLEKEAKNIAKHDAAVERVSKLFDEEIERSRDRLRHAFNDIRNLLNERERILLDDLDSCKKQGDQMLHQREQRAKELKDGADHSAKMNDRQLDDLRSQIRRFTAERRFEDELGGSARFRCEPDRLIDMVKNFGEVVPIGNGGGGDAQPQKHSSMSSLVSSGDGDGSHIGGNKSITEIALGGIMMKSDSMDADQLVELTRSLRENLKLQGIAEDILPEVCGASAMMPARRRPPTQGQRDDRNSFGGRSSGGGSSRNGGSQRR